MDASASLPWKDRLRQERIRRNWRQQDLADELGTTVSTIQRWERGSQQPSTYFRIKLCALFGKSAEELGLVEMPATASSAPEAQKETLPEPEPVQPDAAEPEGLWTIPYLRNPHFTGRDELLEQLVQQLSPEQPGGAGKTRHAVLGQPQAVKGLGGIGKTQIAVEYAYRARQQNQYTHFLWINAASLEAILTSFQTLAERLPNFAAKDEKDQHKLIVAILRWLETCPEPWLMIFDNADELTLVQPYLPQQGQGSILLTTRAYAVGWLANSIEVDQMGLVEGTQFLLHRTGRLSASDEESNEATNIVIALDGFPLALDQAGAYIEETGCSFGDYLRLYEQHRAKLLARRGRQASNYPASVATTWDLSFQKVEQTQPAAAELLRLCAFLSPDHIPEELITEGATHWPVLLQEAVTDPLRFNELLEALLAFSLIKRLAEERLLSLHRLVQVVQLDRMNLKVQRQWAEQVVRAVNALFPADPKYDTAAWPQCLRYLDQVQACGQLIQQHHLQSPEAADLLDRAGLYLQEHASYSLAESLYQRALSIAEQRLGSEHLQVASLLNHLGFLYWQQGYYERAEPLYQRALRIREQVLGSEHPQVASLLNNLGILYWQRGQYEQAKLLCQRALHIREQALGPEHPQLASALTNLGILYYEQGHYEQAEPLYQRSLHIQEQALGPEHPQLVSVLSNLGILYHDQGHYEQAETLYQRALHIQEQALGPEHPYVSYPLANLGDLYYEQGHYEQAETLYQRALHIREHAFGSYHHEVAYPLNGLANLSRDQGQYEQAEAFYQRALSLRQEHLGPQHADVAETLQDLARLRQMQQQPIEALSLYQQALAIREQVFGAQHPKTCETRQRLHAVLLTLGKTEEATVLEETHVGQAMREIEQK